MSVAAADKTIGKTIADQLVARRLSWKSYQENLPIGGADQVNYSDGVFTDKTDFSKIQPTLNPPLATSDIVALYAVKHNPFAYFKNVQEGRDPNNSLRNIVDFDGADGLFADLGAWLRAEPFIYRAEPMQRPAWPRQCRRLLQL